MKNTVAEIDHNNSIIFFIFYEKMNECSIYRRKVISVIFFDKCFSSLDYFALSSDRN